MSRLYRSVGASVYQADKVIARCRAGHQGQLASDIAARIADLLNRDFRQFCVNVAASCDTHPKDGDVEQAPLVSGAVAKPDAQTQSPTKRASAANNCAGDVE